MTDPTTQTGTVTDVEYPGGYFWHQAPALMNYIAAVNGCATRRTDNAFTYCELGCGRGTTATVLAALHPHGLFFACDINSAHIRSARDLADRGGVRNLKFFESDFAGMLAERLPDFDFVTIHGIWSWVSNKVQSDIKAFLTAKLKPGGLVMLSYNAMPGWAHIQPIQRMMRTYADGIDGDSVTKARQAYSYVRFLSDNNAKYFLAHPAALQKLDEVAAADVRYVAHEYLAPESKSFYFSEVASDMREAGLAYCGNMLPSLNYPLLSIAPQFRNLVMTARSRIALEMNRDFVANTSFRLDLYVARLPFSAVGPVETPCFDDIVFRLAAKPEQLALKGEYAGIGFNFEACAEGVKRVHALLTTGPADAAKITRALGVQDQLSLRMIQDLVLAHHIWPCAIIFAPADCSKLQSALIEAALRERQEHVIMLFPPTGAADYVPVAIAAAALRESERTRV